MKLWVVNYVEGDYIGWFEGYCAGVYQNKDEAEKRASKIRKDKHGYHFSVDIQEVVLNRNEYIS